LDIPSSLCAKVCTIFLQIKRCKTLTKSKIPLYLLNLHRILRVIYD
jgi:hypothetical protein